MLTSPKQLNGQTMHLTALFSCSTALTPLPLNLDDNIARNFIQVHGL